jgi:hypothetical protein
VVRVVCPAEPGICIGRPVKWLRQRLCSVAPACLQALRAPDQERGAQWAPRKAARCEHICTLAAVFSTEIMSHSSALKLIHVALAGLLLVVVPVIAQHPGPPALDRPESTDSIHSQLPGGGHLRSSPTGSGLPSSSASVLLFRTRTTAASRIGQRTWPMSTTRSLALPDWH